MGTRGCEKAAGGRAVPGLFYASLHGNPHGLFFFSFFLSRRADGVVDAVAWGKKEAIG